MIRTLGDARFELGEGLLWDAQAGRLMMTDILRGALVAVDIDRNEWVEWQMPEPIGWVLPTAAARRYVVGLRSGIAQVDTASDAVPSWLLSGFPGSSRCRLNDACVDASGRIWLGSAGDDFSGDGWLACFTPQRGLVVHDAGFGVANGPVVSPDQRHLYVSDTMRRVIYRYPLSLVDGSLGKREIFITFDPGYGYPDGMCFDREGNLWIAMWAGAKVIKVDADGREVQSHRIPAPNVTNVCFCGTSFDRLLVSTATLDMDAAARAAHPHAGRLFEISDHGSQGLPSPVARIE
jgi:sugar lactone lactonase YvrE